MRTKLFEIIFDYAYENQKLQSIYHLTYNLEKLFEQIQLSEKKKKKIFSIN